MNILSNKIIKVCLAILGGMSVVFYIFSPILIATLWLNISGLNVWSYFLFGVGLLATLFRAIKVGFLNKE